MTTDSHSSDCSHSLGVELRDSSQKQPISPRLLVSIRDAKEASIAIAAGVDWIDLKEPGSGALGRADRAVAESVAAHLSHHAQRSAALGELKDLTGSVAAQFAQLFPFLKVGLASTSQGQERDAWQAQLVELAEEIKRNCAELIPVIYADYALCDAPQPAKIVAVAEQLRAKFLLIDTFTKDGRRLTDWLNVAELNAIKFSTSAFGCQVVIAGSLRGADIQLLRELEPYAFAVRGAVCSGSRAGSICPEKVAQLRDLLHDSMHGSNPQR